MLEKRGGAVREEEVLERGMVDGLMPAHAQNRQHNGHYVHLASVQAQDIQRTHRRRHRGEGQGGHGHPTF